MRTLDDLEVWKSCERTKETEEPFSLMRRSKRLQDTTQERYEAAERELALQRNSMGSIPEKHLQRMTRRRRKCEFPWKRSRRTCLMEYDITI